MTELGQKLKEAREAKGISLDELQEITKIQKRYLISIEEGNYEVLPGDFYVRAFIKQYAEAVDLKPESILEEHKGEIPAPPPPQDITQLSRVKRSREAVTNSASSKIMDHMPKILITLLIVSIAVGIWLVFQAVSNQEPEQEQAKQNNTKTEAEVEKAKDSPLEKAAEEKKEEQKEEKKAEPKKEETPQPVQEIKVVESAGKVSTMELRNNTALMVEINAKGRTYVDIKNGAGKLFFTKTLAQGETYQQDLSAEDVIRLNIGSTPNTEIKINGQVVPFPKTPNEAYHQILVIKNLRMQPQQPAQQ
ncbi:MAG: helix-turn-helix domain-containing protein [Ectobacillus sp.]